MNLKSAALGGVFGVIAVGPAFAQEDPRDVLIRQLAARLEAVEKQLAELKQASGAPAPAPADIRTLPAQTPVTLSNGRPQITSADGASRFAVRGLLQFDAAAYDEASGSTTDLSSGTNFRRARLGIEGTVGKVWNYALTGEFGGSGVEAAVLNQAWVEYAGWKPFGLSDPLRIRAGAWATPVNLEDGTSNTEGLFLERPAAAELTRSIAAGDGRAGLGVFANGEAWYGHAVLTGGVAGSGPDFDEQAGWLARLAWAPVRGPDHALHLGLNASAVIEPADTAAGLATTKALRLRERAELRVDGTRLVDTGDIAADGMLQTGVELGAAWRNLYASAEAFRFEIDPSAAGAPDAAFGGWYVQGAWTLTGEKRSWNAASGGFQGVRPAHSFDPSAGAWGAWELAARYSVLDLNHAEGAAGAARPASGIRGGEQRVTTVGLNWYPNRTVRFLLDYQWVDIDRLSNAGAPIGEDFEVLSTRAQVSF
jgi:phosphate-selective porin OprO/OprP